MSETRTASGHAAEEGSLVLLYDGVCALCNGVVRFVLKHDCRALFRFAALQSGVARELLGPQAASNDSVALVVQAFTPQQTILRRSDAVTEILRLVGRPRTAAALAALPRPVREGGYRVVAAVRYRFFGRYAVCPVPPPEVRDRFLDLSEE